MHKAILVMTLLLGAATMSTALDKQAGINELDKRVMQVSESLRCLVCQNQTVAESNAELAVDLRKQVREKLSNGMAERDVLDFMVERYGDFVLYRPPVRSTTWVLWFGPFFLLVAAVAALLIKLWKLRQTAEAEPDLLSESQSARADALLHEGRIKDGS